MPTQTWQFNWQTYVTVECAYCKVWWMSDYQQIIVYLTITGRGINLSSFVLIMSPPTLVGRHIVFVLSVTQFVSATPLKLLNRISWNLVGSKDTICSCAFYQEILIAWILWELCPFELRNVPKFTTEAACQCNSSETTEQNFMKLGR